MALALYRRYRPDTFDGVVGQDQVTVPLSRALDEGKLTHAYLFSGPRGCGKTSSARILARCVNCAKGPTSHPCGECESCKDLATGGPGSIDVVEIDAASHNGVEDARELRERAGFAPARDRYKIFILDEAHMVTQQGFNALLKIVEEPPEHVMFIFATTEPEKVIGTIRSRTHHYPFRLVPSEVMGPYLEDVCKKEHIAAEPGVLKLAMRAGGGSMRDTLSVLDQLMVGAVDGVIGYDSAVALLGFTPEALIGDAIDAVINRDGEALYAVVQKVVVGGFDPRRFVEDMLARVRDLLVLSLGGQGAERALSDDAAAEDMDVLRRQASALGLATLAGMAETMNSTLGSMTGAISPRMRLELLAARLLAGMESGFGSVGANQGDRALPPTGSGSQQRQQASAQHGPRVGFIGASRFQQQRNTSAHQSAQSVQPVTGNAQQSQSFGASGTQRSAAASNTAQHNVQSQEWAASPAAGQAQVQGDAPSNQFAHTAGPNNIAANITGTRGEAAADASVGAANATPPQGNAVNSAAVDLGSSADGRSVDERWDAVVAALPSDIREYVSRESVPTVELLPVAPGKMHLSMTFANALSQHAFALAVSSDAAHSGMRAQQIVLDAVFTEFGSNTKIAPTKVAANGERVFPVSRLSSDQLAQVKKQIALAKMGKAVGMTMPTPRASSTQQDAAQDTSSVNNDGDSDDSSHRGNGNGTGAPVLGASSQGAIGSPNASDASDASNTEETANAQTPSLNEDPDSLSTQGGSDAVAANEDDADDDPWLHPLPIPGQDASSSQSSAGVSDALQQPAEHVPHKHVAVPDISDGIDPWAVDVASTPTAHGDGTSGRPDGRSDQQSARPNGHSIGQYGDHTASSGTGIAYGSVAHAAGSAENDSFDASADNMQTGRHPIAPRAEQDLTPRPDAGRNNQSNPVVSDDDPWSHQPPANGMPAHSEPQVAAEEDEYSMDDQSLGDANAMDLEELERLFDVKHIEDFAADDPRNPKNAQSHHKLQEG